MQDGNGAQTDVLSHDHRAGAFVDDDAGAAVRGDGQVLDLGHYAGQIGNARAGGVDFDAAAVARDGNVVSEGAIDGVGDIARGREVRLAQQQVKRHKTIKAEG